MKIFGFSGGSSALSGILLICVLWTALIGGLFALEYTSATDHIKHMVMMDAQAAFNKDQSIRRWAADHGGVYIKVRPGVSPSPYMSHLENRDITTPSGEKLTLINPATMLKQIMGDYAELYGIKGTIVGINPLNPDNKARGWEVDAITELENGSPQVSSFSIAEDGSDNFNLMRPMIADQACIYCHEIQGYQPGDIIGGVGVSIPMKKYRDDIENIILGNAITHGIIFIIGISGLFTWHAYSVRQFKKQLQADRDLKESNDRFATFTRYSPNKIHIKDIKGRYLMINPESEKLLGISNKEAKGKTVQDIFQHENGYSFVKHDSDVIKKDAAIEREEIFGDGEDAKTYLTVKFPIHDASGKTVAIGSSGVDITKRKRTEKEIINIQQDLEKRVGLRTKELTEEISERKLAEQELVNRNELIDLLYRLTAIANEASKMEQGISDCLRVVCEYTSWPIGHIYEISPIDRNLLVPSNIWYLKDEETYRNFKEITMNTKFHIGRGLPGRVLESGVPSWIEDVEIDGNFPRSSMGSNISVKAGFAIPVKVSGQVIAVMEFFSPFIQSEDECLVRVINHAGEQIGRLFERKEIERDLREARDNANSANRAKSTFLSSMSHELRTPLNAIIGFSEFLIHHPEDQLSDDQHTYVKHVSDSGHHLLELINEILDLSKIESGNDDLTIDNVDLSSSCSECFDMARVLVEDSDIKLIFPDLKNEKRTIRVDSKRFKQAIINLLSNAIKYNRANGEVVVDFVETGGGMLKITVTDTGHGIPADKMNHLFKPFSRLGAENSGIEGTGIGLVVTQKLVQMMGGQIGVYSKEGEGSTFWISVPLA